MTFTPTQKELFNKNIEALGNILLKESLKEIKSSKFELILGKDNLDINLKDTSIKNNGGGYNENLLYQDPIKELQAMLNTYNDKYLLYPVLYFYGFGNGILFKALLQNKNHQHIVVFEKDIEIIWIMFHVLDFSNELQSARLMVLENDKLQAQDYNELCSFKPFFQFSRIYFLELMSHYYERFHEDVLELNKKLAETFKNIILRNGNDPLDALQGIEQFVYNLPQMITHPSYKELLSKRKNLSDTAIIVSTGPSLTKQLPLLKKYANKATIFCADSSYPILAKHGIKPDYVCMLERTEITAEFFNHDFGEFDKDIVFVCAGVVHPKAIEYLKGRNLVITQKVLAFPYYINLKDFSYAAVGFSVAHTLSYLATYLSHKNIIFIGQDLAYAENGNSHPDDYQNSANYESQMYEHILTKAYGEKEEVKTHSIWLLFKNWFENEMIPNTRKMGITTYNCTEGGARIEGTIEKPFLWACENLLDKDLNKPFEKLEPLSLNKQNEFLLKAYYKVYQSIKHCRDFSKILSNDFEKIQSVYLSLNEKEEYLNLAIEKIDEFKNKLEDIKQMQDLYEILQPLRTQFELNLARIYVLNPKTKEDAFNKSILWIKEHLEFMELVYGHIKAQENALIKNILPLEEKLKERKLDKWMERVRR
ncbi:TPA: motility associated factor glycosyltransferase family protein [Campylobacter jejuni]|uniref:motility associated factor glycosyltransferase family protein n=3 Tax=Campylobacter jejuni TaxID=197 RepID=UPI0024BEEE57|nr:motility associated factor glycosyltransferase family protein [Campylobacter jejuni]HEB9413502.1 motility associated factor glycosyltransferase family protein [Campylobacter jejuni]HEB9415313.1 motility associated factor glycosyltransferase family protein [Campylobacter jejuni]HEB9418638.1 motility associated factor glycosyltransferase family protein [Campylobacter jejuni]HEB9425557.1 motility associated factor glycosyltransferase family protein [Campylobacter jejuni]HEB9427414.1 motility a